MRAPTTAERIGRAALAIGSAAALSSLTRSAFAVADPPTIANLAFHIEPSPDSLRWSYVIENVGRTPVEVVADRRLLSIPGASAAPSAASTSRRGGRVRPPASPRAVCVAPGAPSSNENAHRVTLAPGTRYVEGFDVRDICGVDLPPQIRPGEQIHWQYRFARARGTAAAIVLDDAPTPVTEWRDTTVVPGDAASWPPLGPEAARFDQRLDLHVHATSSVASLNDASATVTITSAGRFPLWTLFRPGVIRFSFTSPNGQRIECRRTFREYTPVREFFVRFGQGQSRSETVQLGAACPVDLFTQPGVYRGQALYETRATGERFGLVTFVGRSGSPFFFVRVTHGAQAGLYAPLSPIDPFARPTASASPVVNDASSASPVVRDEPSASP